MIPVFTCTYRKSDHRSVTIKFDFFTPKFPVRPVMGVTLQQWRISIGLYTQLVKTREKRVGIDIRLPNVSLLIRVLLFMLLAIYGIERNPGPQTRGKGGNAGNTTEIRPRGPGRGPKPTASTAHAEHETASNTPAQVVTDQSAQLSQSLQPFISQWFSTSNVLTQSSSNQRSVDQDQDLTRQTNENPSESENEDGFQTSDEIDENIPNQGANIPISILLDIQKSVKRLDKKFDKMEKSLKDLKKENKELKHKNAELCDNVKNLQKKVQDLSKKNQELYSKCENLEGQSRRQNLKFYNIPDSAGESWDVNERKVRDYIQNDLGLETTNISIERAHRLHSRLKPRPVIVKFSFFKDKEMVLNTFRQKNRAAPRQQSDSIGSNDIRIGKDFPDRVRNQRSLLYPFNG